MFNRLLLSLFAGLYCSMFFLSNNWYIFSTTQNVVLVVMGTILCSLAILFTAFIILIILKFILRKFKNEFDIKNWINEFADPLVVALSLLLCAILLRNTLADLYLPPMIIVPLVFISVILARSKIKSPELRKLSIAFLILTVVSTSSLAYDVFSARKTATPISNWTTRNKKYNDQIKFIKKPNVYFIITESYPNKEALEKIYNFDNHNFFKKLEEREFALHHKYYSNYNHTLASLPSLFGMEHHYYSISIGNFDSIGGRSMLEAKTYNPVVDIFRQNNYKIQYIHRNAGLIPKGASVDYCFPAPPDYLALETFLSHQDTTKKSIFSSRNRDFFEILDKRSSIAAANDTPYFSFIYTTAPHHSPSRMKTNNRSEINKILETFRQNYNERIQSANTHLLRLLDSILKNDKDPLIIIAGDHGPWGYRLKEDGNSKVIPDSLFALDRFGILMAIRFPKDYSQQFDSNDFKTHVNLFRYVFAYLSNSNKILEKKVEDSSYDYGPKLAIYDGKILNKYLPLKVGKK